MRKISKPIRNVERYFVKRAAHYVAEGQTIFVFYVQPEKGDWKVLKFEEGCADRKRLLSLVESGDQLDIVWAAGAADEAVDITLSMASGGSLREA